MKLKFNDNTILILATFNALVLIISKGVVFAEDSESYINAWQDSLSQGYIDFTRTPTYPLILGYIRLGFPQDYVANTSICLHRPMANTYLCAATAYLQLGQFHPHRVICHLCFSFLVLPST